MDASGMVDYIRSAFEDVEVLAADGNSFFYYAPEHVIPERTFGFATVVTNDLYDQFSDLDREGVYRLNMGVSKQTFDSVVGGIESPDFRALDRIMPHPIYGKQHWLSVLKPESTLERVKELLAEAYALGVRQHQLRSAAKA